MLRFYSVKVIDYDRLPRNHVTVSTDIMQKARLISGNQLTFQFGNRKATVKILGCHGSAAGTSVFLSKELFEALLIPGQQTLNIMAGEQHGLWRFGPLIGIFANRGEKHTRPFGEQTSFFSKLRTAGKQLNSLVFCFGPGDIDWDNKIITGAIPPQSDDKTSGWKAAALPFPDAVYDRGLFPRGEKRRLATEVRKILRNYPGLKFFNPSFFGKWKTHKLLSKHEVLQEHLPDTRFFASGEEVFELLEKYKVVYLKPSGGSSGRGIMQVSAGQQGFSVKNRNARKVNTLRFSDKNQLNRYLHKVIGENRYIAQQGLRLVTTQDCPLDIRVLMQKNRRGVWNRTGMAARIAGRGSYLSNIHAGGHAVKISSVLPLIFQDLTKLQQIQNDINRLSSLIASWVSSESSPLFGEIAVDLGIDENGKVWIIELNAIPGRSVFRRIGAMKIASNAISRPIEYAYFLSGFAPQQDK